MTDEYDIIQEKFDFFLYKEGGQPTTLHLPEEQKMPFCGREYRYTEKPTQVFPKGWRRVCEDCLETWKENNE